MMPRLIELDVRMMEHGKRIDDANRAGWLRSSDRGSGRMSLGALAGAVVALLSPIAPGRERTETAARPDAVAAANAARSRA
jgi:hypothetical protein